MIFTPANIVFGLFVFISGLLLIYYLYLFSRIAFYKKKNTPSPDLPPLTTIVCAKNEEKNLEKNIPLLLKQQYNTHHEILVVNDNSDDDTKLLLQWMAGKHPALQILNLEREAKLNAGKKYPLSVGIRETKTENLLLTDADCAPASAYWAAKMQSGYKPGIEIILGYGAYEKHPGLLNKVIRFETFHSALQYLSYALAGLPYMGVGRNLSYKKSLFFKHKGFSSISHIPGGDDDLFISKAATATNTEIVIDPDAHTISTPKKSWGDWKHQKTRHYSTSKYYKAKHKFLLGCYSLSQFMFYPLLIATTILYGWPLALGILVLKSTVQYLIFSKAMKKLNEADLIKWIFVMDLWMVGYYLFFASTLWKKERKTW